MPFYMPLYSRSIVLASEKSLLIRHNLAIALSLYIRDDTSYHRSIPDAKSYFKKLNNVGTKCLWNCRYVLERYFSSKSASELTGGINYQ